MKIKINKTCTSLLSQTRGLMFSPKKTLLFVFNKKRRILLHNWFVFYPINLIFLNKHKKVVEIKKNFKPFGAYRTRKEASFLIETPYTTNVRIGDKVTII